MAPSVRHMQALQAISAVVTLYAIVRPPASLGWWGLSLAVYFLTACLGLSVTLHRCLTHRAFKLPRSLEIAFSLLAMLGGAGSSIGWVAMHRAHHALGDGEKDPHAVERLGWRVLVSEYDYEFDPRYAKDLLRDPAHVFLHRRHTLILAAWALALGVMDRRLAIYGFFVPAFAQITIANLANILGHGYGYRNFETRDKSTNNALIAILAWGEGWHNNHHAAPADWSLRRRWWEIDPGALCIQALRAVGLAEVPASTLTSAGETRATAPASRRSRPIFGR